MKVMAKSRRRTSFYVWDQMKLVEKLTDLYIKNRGTEQGLIKGMLGEQLSMGLNKTIHAELNRLLIAIEQCNDEEDL
jgi:predicted ATP-grasp superfamily ATP-dependent carboligase